MQHFLYSKNGKEMIYTSYGRVALALALQKFGLKKGENVLLPAYICNSILSPFNYLGLKVKYYLVQKCLEPEFDSLVSQIDTNTRAVLVVNYFGFPQNLAKIKEICLKKQLYLIEDNAHGFLSSDDHNWLGTRGDAGILSFRKSCPLPNGAALLLNRQINSLPGDPLVLRSAREDELNYVVRGLKCTIRNLGIPINAQEDSPQEENNLGKYLKRFSFFSHWFIKQLNGPALIRKKRKTYLNLLNTIGGHEAEPVFPHLREGVAPLYFCVFVKGEREEYIRKIFNQHKLRAFPWPGLLPLEVQNKYLDLMLWAKQIVCFTL